MVPSLACSNCRGIQRRYIDPQLHLQTPLLGQGQRLHYQFESAPIQSPDKSLRLWGLYRVAWPCAIRRSNRWGRPYRGVRPKSGLGRLFARCGCPIGPNQERFRCWWCSPQIGRCAPGQMSSQRCQRFHPLKFACHRTLEHTPGFLEWIANGSIGRWRPGRIPLRRFGRQRCRCRLRPDLGRWSEHRTVVLYHGTTLQGSLVELRYPKWRQRQLGLWLEQGGNQIDLDRFRSW